MRYKGIALPGDEAGVVAAETPRPYASSNRFSFIRPARTWARSYCACCTSQLSALPPKTLDSLTAISGDMPRFSFTSSESVVRVTPRAAAASVMLGAKVQYTGAAQSLPGEEGFS